MKRKNVKTGDETLKNRTLEMTICDETTRIETVVIKRIEREKNQGNLISIIFRGVTKIQNLGLQKNPKTQTQA